MPDKVKNNMKSKKSKEKDKIDSQLDAGSSATTK
jgi:hypothetical protein